MGAPHVLKTTRFHCWKDGYIGCIDRDDTFTNRLFSLPNPLARPNPICCCDLTGVARISDHGDSGYAIEARSRKPGNEMRPETYIDDCSVRLFYRTSGVRIRGRRCHAFMAVALRGGSAQKGGCCGAHRPLLGIRRYRTARSAWPSG